ncbi:MAG: thiamine diphosphokinase [Candidatus Cloacimonetes bacterium]|jgi:thiamine pyrophosphokinase|nr:thiamine diphosphokinase [Candidatus Cloacimonadota bacterium]MBT7469201.1 thiamine diphosphokinase [Candidatus Cloacimonadota bacterium]
MNNHKIAIVCNGKRIDNLTEILKNVDTVIAADGGANFCLDNNISPDFIIGDLDSIKLNCKIKNESLIQITDQNLTDLQKSLNFAEKLNPTEILVISAFGKREDHSIANLLIFQNFSGKAKLKILEKNSEMIILEAGNYFLKNQEIGQTISLFSFDKIEKLTLIGFKYPLLNETFQNNFIGVSNEILQNDCEVKFKTGKLFFIKNL